MPAKAPKIKQLQIGTSSVGGGSHSSRPRQRALATLAATICAAISLSGCALTGSGNNLQAQPSSLSITTTSLSAAQWQSSYQATVKVSGGNTPYLWSVSSGTLPTGLSLTSANGNISGTATQQGSFSFTVQVQDSSSPLKTAKQDYTIAVSKPGAGLSITTSTMPGAIVGTAYGMNLGATGGTSPYKWSVISGTLPAGLSLNSSGAVSGTPSQQGTAQFTVQVADSSQKTAKASLSIVVSPSGSGRGNGTLDQYGGRLDINCSAAKGYFYNEKVGNHWYFCDPLGNAFVAMSVGNVLTNTNPTKDCNGVNTYPIYLSKYGDATYNWGWQTLKRMTSWGFNTVGQDSGAYVNPAAFCSNCSWPGGKQPIPLPYITEMKPAENASINVNGYISEPIKDEMGAMNNNYQAWRGAALYDMFDPKLNTYVQKSLQKNTAITGNYPYLLAILTDDSDYFFGAGAGPDFASGHTNANVAWMTLITSPVQTYTPSTPLGGQSFLYQTTQDFSKTLATNPTTVCSISNPCSLRDYLWQKYNGNISALNASWGSNYSTFDSTGHQVRGETIAIGDGSRTSFTYNLAHQPISPFSVLIFVAGTAEVGDCPWFRIGCSSTTTNTGSLGSPTAGYLRSSSSIDYSSGTITLSFVKAPTKGSVITADYVYGGWMAGGAGLMDEDGSHTAWVGTNPFCLEGANPNYPTYYSCSAGHNPPPDANPNFGADLDNWVSQMAAQYFKTMHDNIKAVSNLPYFGLDVISSYGAPAYSKFLEGAAPYIDGAYVGLHYWQPNPSPAAFQSAYQYLTQYLGDKPFMTFSVETSQANSSYYCSAGGSSNFPTQSARGQAWFDQVNYLLSTTSFNGDIPFVGADWWSWQDFQSLNQGLVSLLDNAYDGHEDVVSKVLCSSPIGALSCGGEAGNFGDAISQIKAANALWLK